MKTKVRITLVGDEKVGKSSIISALLSESFPEKVAPVVPEVTIPPDKSVDKVTTQIIDTSSRPADVNKLEAEIRAADVICIVYDAMNPDSFARVAKFWLPRLRQVQERTDDCYLPVLLVGNRIDLRPTDNDAHALLEKLISPVMDQFREVETCIECSAKQLIHVHEVFHFAQKAVLYPMSVLYDAHAQRLRPAAVRALKRIFRLCDQDKDGYLSDQELSEFQMHCFDAPLSASELAGVKAVVADNSPDGLAPAGLTLAGFLFLHHLFIIRGKLETTWTVLRRFGYSDELELESSILNPPFEVGEDQVVQLSAGGIAFLERLFRVHDKDGDGGLSAGELEELFQVTPGAPWGSAFPVSAGKTGSGQVSLDGWLGQWHMTAMLEWRTLLAYLAYLGYPGDVRTALHKVGRRDLAQRALLLVYVFGSPAAGKSALLDALVHNPFQTRHNPTREVQFAVNHLADTRYLMLQEIPNLLEGNYIRELGKQGGRPCDVVVFLYDQHDPTSLMYVSEIYRKFASWKPNVPVLFCASKGDLSEVPQEEQSAAELCRSEGLAHPVQVSAARGQLAALLAGLAAVAQPPPPPPTRYQPLPTTFLIGIALLAGFFVSRRFFFKS